MFKFYFLNRGFGSAELRDLPPAFLRLVVTRREQGTGQAENPEFLPKKLGWAFAS